MDDATGPRRARPGASALGAAALLVLSFGPSALALSPSSAPAPSPTPRAAISAPAPSSAASALPREIGSTASQERTEQA